MNTLPTALGLAGLAGIAGLALLVHPPAEPQVAADDTPASDVVPAAAAEPGTLPVAEIRARLAAPGAHEPFLPATKLGLPSDLAPYVPADNPLTPAKVELGRELYFDPRLSADGTISCATCHHPDTGWTDCAPVSTGIHGQKGGRSAPTVANRIFGKTQFWDGRAATLEEQAVGPIANPVEMGFTVEAAAERLNGIEGYRLQFEAVFGGPATSERIGQAIAAFERTVLVGASPNDWYEATFPWEQFDPDEEEDPEVLARYEAALAGEEAHRLSDAAWRGRELFFGKANCSACHVGVDLTDELFHNLGIGVEKAEPDLGRMAVTGLEADRGAFKTPSVRNVKDTAPYMHDGSLATLMEVVEHYAKGGTPNPALSDKIFPLELSAAEKRDLVTFLEEGCQGEVTPVAIPRLP